MTRADVQREALQLPERDRLRLAQDLWASVTNPNTHASDLELPGWQAALLDERLAEIEKNPETGSPWEEVEKRIWPDR